MSWQDQEVCLDGTVASYTVSYTNGTGVPTYQWYTNNEANNTGGTAIPGETSDTFLPATDQPGATWYYCQIAFSSGGCSAYFRSAFGCTPMCAAMIISSRARPSTARSSHDLASCSRAISSARV